MVRALLGRHRHEEGLLEAFGQFSQHLALDSTNQQRCERLADAIEMAIADHLVVLIANLVLGEELKRRSQAMLVDELDNRHQLLQAVLERRARQDDGVGRGNALDAAGRPCVPVLDSLRFVEDDQIRRPPPNQVEVKVHGVVVGDGEEARRGSVALLAPRAHATDHGRLAIREARDFSLPLVLERRRTDDQHTLDAELARHDLRRGNGLDRLAEPHLVGDQRAAGTGGKQRSLALVCVQLALDQPPPRAVASAARKGLADPFAPARAIAHLGDKPQHVVVAPKVVVDGRRLGQERLECGERLGPQRVLGIEVLRRERRQGAWTRGAAPKLYVALRAVVEDDFTVRWLKAPPEDGCRLPLPLEPPEDELDVFARPQRVGREVRARAIILARLHAANRDAVGAGVLWVTNLEVGEYGRRADVRQRKPLVPSELAAQSALPGFE